MERHGVLVSDGHAGSAPGVIADQYRRRWELEKVFNKVETKLGEGGLRSSPGGAEGQTPLCGVDVQTAAA